MLALPRIDCDIPLRLVPAAARQRGAHLALVLIRAGQINARTLPARMDTDHIATCRASYAAVSDQLNQILDIEDKRHPPGAQ